MNINNRKLSWGIVKKSLLPFFILLLFFTGYIFYKIKISPLISSSLNQELKKYIGTVFIICVIFVIQRIIGAVAAWYEQNIAAQTLTHLDDEIIPLLRRAFKIIF